MNPYRTKEMWLAAALEVQGIFITRIELDSRQSATFLFEDVPEDVDMTKVEEQYWNNGLSAPVFAMKEKVHEIRTRMNKLKEVNSNL